SAIAKETEDTALKSALVLELVKQKVPERAKPAIQRAIDNSLEKKARIKAERKISGEIEVRETNQPPPGILVAETLPVPSTKEELIEKEAGKEIVQETKRQEKRRQSIEAVKERLGALKTDIAIRP
ncbi:MAG: hypothetical protein HY368_00600, partial [Candidatus Aenigmarchaeota archaeon]|nr:hypothetical protein [Candidatus Aenigmarchaeota archaeon]